MKEKNIIHLLGNAAPDTQRLGGKGAMLSLLTAAGFDVPHGFVIDTEAYHFFVDQAGLGQLESEAHTSPEAAVRFREALLSAPFPDILAEPVLAAWRTHLKGSPCAIRSSTPSEDSASTSFAGQHESLLNITTDQSILESIKKCWASLWSDAAIAYRQRSDQALKGRQAMAVVAQEMIPAESAGVLFTRKPGDPTAMVVEANWGIGESVVSGTVTPDSFTVSYGKDGFVLKHSYIGDKALQTVPASQGVQTIETPSNHREKPSLAPEAILELARTGALMEKALGEPQDIEWASVQGRIYILQSRPITHLRPAESGPSVDSARHVTVWDSGNTREVCPNAVPALTGYVGKTSMGYGIFRFITETMGIRIERPADDILAVLYGRAYMNLTWLLDAYSQMPGKTPRGMAQVMGFPMEYYTGGDPDATVKGLQALRPIVRMFGLLRSLPRKVKQLVGPIDVCIEELRTMDLSGRSTDELRQLWDQAMEMANQAAWLHITYSSMATGLWEPLEKTLAKWFGENEGRAVLAQLMAGLDCMAPAEFGILVREMAQMARSSTAVRAALLSAEPNKVIMALRANPGASEFLARWDEFMSRYGARAIAEADISMPRWEEDPRFLIQVIQGYLSEAATPLESIQKYMKRQQDQRGLALERVSKRAGLIMGPLFRWLIKTIQYFMVARENRKDLVARGFAALRHVALELGRRMTENGRLERVDDVFHLMPGEFQDDSLDTRVLKAIVVRRRQEYALNLTLDPPFTIVGQWQPEEKLAASPQGQIELAQVLRGMACSPGEVNGTARVIRDPTKEAHRLHPGEILVTQQTDPGWTPLFLNAGGVVTELGGMLSHSATVAREYGIPAVLSVKDATRAIQDGDIITVNGTTGTVQMTSEAAAREATPSASTIETPTQESQSVKVN